MTQEKLDEGSEVHYRTASEPMMAYPSGRPYCRKGFLWFSAEVGSEAAIAIGDSKSFRLEKGSLRMFEVPYDDSSEPQMGSWHLPGSGCGSVRA